MKYYSMILILIGFVLQIAFARSPDILWTKTFGGTDFDYGYSVQQTFDGGYIIVGFTGSFGEGLYDVWLLKTDANGDTLWTKTYGGTGREWGGDVQQTPDSGYIIVGGGYGSDIWLLKTDANGDILWTKLYGGWINDAALSVDQTLDGGYILAGYTESFGSGDVYIIRTDSHGDSLWTRVYGGERGDYAYSVQQTFDSGYIVAGFTESFSVGEFWGDPWLIKMNTTGDTLWTKTYDRCGPDTTGGSDTLWTTYNDMARSVQQTSDGGYILAGRTFIGEPWNTWEVYLIKTDAYGNKLWSKIYGVGSVEDDYAYSVQQTSDGGYILAGHTEIWASSWNEVYLIKTDANGDTLWTKTWGGEDFEYAEEVRQTSDGGYIIVGGTGSFGAGWGDVFLMKIEPEFGINEDDHTIMPDAFCELKSNPTKDKVLFNLELPQDGLITLRIYDTTGRLVGNLSSYKSAGCYQIPWSTKVNGVYFYTFESSGHKETGKLVIVH